MFSRYISRYAMIFSCVMLGAALFLAISSAQARERLILFGGGPRPVDALARFVDWAGKERAHILVIPWASAEPQASFEAIARDFARFHPATVEAAPRAPLTDAGRTQFLMQLKNATGVFFTGGDQVRIMDALKDQALMNMLRGRYSAGVVFGGTSAGTAIMSRQMITGEGDFTVIDGEKVKTREGLGLLPGVIVDQHFIKRQRENRLFGLILRDRETLGVGIDEGTALVVTDNRYGEVIGASQVMMVDARSTRPGALLINVVKPGERFDLIKRTLEKAHTTKKSARGRAIKDGSAN